MINTVVDYIKQEQYRLQPTKSVILEILPAQCPEEMRSPHS